MKNTIFSAKVAVVLMAILFYVNPVFATDISNSKLATGTIQLFQDASNWLLILSPSAGVAFTVYFLIRRAGADEVDQKKWNNRIMIVIVSVIGAVIASGTISVLTSYYA